MKIRKIKKIIPACLLFFSIFNFYEMDVYASPTSNLRIQILSFCGNNHKEINEQCDGSDLNGSSCVAQGFSSGNLACNSSCVFDTSACVAIPQPICGNNIKEAGESCDGTDLAGGSCVSRGFTNGSISCNSSCVYNTSACTTIVPPPPSGGGGGGGGGGGIPFGGGSFNTVTSAIFEGKAYPRSTITLIKDAQVAATTIAGSDASFKIILSNLSGGNYLFSIYSEDNNGIRSSPLTFPVSLTIGATTQISNIFIAPTIAIDKSEAKQGDNIAIFGQAYPNSEIAISVNSENEIFKKIKTDKNGIYLYNFDTSVLENGQHHTKSRASLDGEISSLSSVLGFIVGTKNVPIELPAKKILKGDFNNDKKINLIDFSIAAYWYKRPLPAGVATANLGDINGDGKVDLIDFSIMAFNWTG